MQRILGGHVSAAGGVEKAIERAAEIGGNAAQIFSGSPRVWQRPDLAKIDPQKIDSKKQEYGVKSIFTHALYLINFASENPELVEKSKKALAFDLAFDGLIQGSGVVVHLGSHQGKGWEAVRDQVASSLKELLSNSPENSLLLIENAASQNGKIGGTLEEVKWLIDEVSSPKLGWCFDTCHGFAGAYYLGKPEEVPTAEAVKGQQVLSAVSEIERLDLAESLKCIHVNDSRDPYASGRDRHANLGEGEMKLEDLSYFLQHPLFNQKPLIIEVPGVDKTGPDRKNMDVLKKLVGEKSE